MYDIDTIREYVKNTEAMTEHSERWRWAPPAIPTHELTVAERRAMQEGRSLLSLSRQKKIKFSKIHLDKDV